MDKELDLTIDAVSLLISGLEILNLISFEVYRSELLALIGPNGAGKTSLLNCVSGIYHPTRGKIQFNGRDIAGFSSHAVAKIGIARTFQHAELFKHMTVQENILVGRHTRMKQSLLSNGLFWGKTIKEEISHRKSIERILDFLDLQRFRKSQVSGLPYGIQKIVGLGRALALAPKILLLDEPSAGMTRPEKENLARFILRIKYEMGITMLWVEHDMQMVGDLADRVVVLNFGAKIAEGRPGQVLSDPHVVEAYIGSDASIREDTKPTLSR